jgi:signal transduction histidine kinase
VADRAGIAWRAVPAALWSRRSWLALAHLITGGLMWAAPVYLAVGVASVAGQVSRSVDAPHNKLINVSVALGVLAVALFGLFPLTPRFTRWQRARFHVVLGVELVPHPPGPVRSRRFWRQACYHAIGGLLCAVSAALVALLVGVGAVLVMLPLIAPKWGVPLPITALGAALVMAAPWLARAAASVDLVLAGALLQPSGAEALAQRVRSLSASRAGAVDAADAERRRIERNLHDGTQQRLVSLAMNLGMTRAALRDGPPELRQAVANAHEEAKQALTELRDFIRGLHPAVLDELGLDAALSGLAARSPVPVRLTVELDRRPTMAVEAIAYFVVSEALSNVARHAAASRAEVLVRQGSGGLVLSITDDGCGGADPARGTGLRGLRQRVESVDGTLHIDSPADGPTSILVELPCGS